MEVGHTTACYPATGGRVCTAASCAPCDTAQWGLMANELRHGLSGTAHIKNEDFRLIHPEARQHVPARLSSARELFAHLGWTSKLTARDC